MTLNVEKMKDVTWLTIYDPDMRIFNKIDNFLCKNGDIEVLKRTLSFETPIYEYTYNKIPFGLIIHEQVEETIITINNKYDYNIIKNLIEQSL